MRESLILIVLPCMLLVRWVENFRMIQLLCFDLSKILVDLKVPFSKDLGVSEDGACQLTNALIPDCRICYHIVSEILHLFGILGEILWQSSIMTS